MPNEFDDPSFLSGLSTEGPQGGAPDPFNPPEPKKRPWFDLGDTLMAVPRGVVGAVKGVYNLADTVTMDALPDWNKNPFGESTSFSGSLVEGAAQFTAGFIPFGGFGAVGGILGGAGKVGKILGTARSLDKAAEGAGFIANVTGSAVRRVTLGSAAAGFTAFDGHSGRLSDLIESYPSLANPVTGFLSAKPGDSEVVGRLKNALEQAGMGAFTEAVLLGLKGIRAGQRVRDAGGTPAEVDAAVLAEAPTEQVAKAYRASQGQPALDEFGNPLGFTDEAQAAGQARILEKETALAKLTPEESAAMGAKAQAKYPGLSERDAVARMIRDEAGKTDAGQGQGKPLSPEAQKSFDERMAQKAAQAAEDAQAKVPDVSATPAQRTRLPMLRDLGLDDAAVARFTKAFESKSQALEETFGAGAGVPSGEIANLNPRNLTAADRLQAGLEAADLNLSHFNTTEAADALHRTIEDLYRPEMAADIKALGKQTFEAQTRAALAETAELVGTKNPDVFAAQVAVRSGRTLQTLEELAPRIQSDAILLKAGGKSHINLVKEMNLAAENAGGRNIDAILMDLTRSLQTNAALEASVKGQRAQVARIFGNFRNEVPDFNIPPELQRLAADPVRLSKMVQEAGGREALVKAFNKHAKAFEMGGDEALRKAMRTTVGTKFLNMTVEAFMGAVLSSPKTFVVNFFGHTVGAFYLPLERAFGSMLIRGSGGRLAPALDVAMQAPIVRDSMAQLTAIKTSAAEAFTMLRESGFSPESTLTDARLTERFARNPAITAENAGLSADSIAGQAVNWIGKAARFPTAVLQTADVFSKNTINRAYARGRLQGEALDAVAAGKLRADQVAGHVEQRLLDLTMEGQAYTQKAVIENGLKIARQEGMKDPAAIEKFVVDFYNKTFDPSLAALSKEAVTHTEVATFTNAQLPGTLTHSIQRLVSKHPSMRLVAPFVNTPANLLKFAAQRVDAVSVTRYVVGRVWPRTMPAIEETSSAFLRDMLSGDPVRAANAVGRVSLGISAMTFFTHEALSGNITGHGPSDPHQRRALLDSGWLPYAFKVGDRYISYQRLDPFGTIIGTAADYAEALNHAEDIGDEDVSHIGMGMAIAMANNFTNKSYLTGVANLIGALQAPEKKLPEFFRRQVAAFVPNVLATAGYGVGQDAYARDVRSFMDAVKAKIPGLSDTVAPRRNILGEPLERPRATDSKNPVLETAVEMWDPIQYNRTKDDTVRQELAALGHSWEPPKRTMNGQDLIDLPLGKTNAYDRWQELQGQVVLGGRNLRQALLSEIRSAAYQRLTPESVDGLVSPRVDRISSIVASYRARALKQLFVEAPALKEQNTAYTLARKQRRRGIESSILPKIGQ